MNKNSGTRKRVYDKNRGIRKIGENILFCAVCVVIGIIDKLFGSYRKGKRQNRG